MNPKTENVHHGRIASTLKGDVRLSAMRPRIRQAGVSVTSALSRVERCARVRGREGTTPAAPRGAMK